MNLLNRYLIILFMNIKRKNDNTIQKYNEKHNMGHKFQNNEYILDIYIENANDIIKESIKDSNKFLHHYYAEKETECNIKRKILLIETCTQLQNKVIHLKLLGEKLKKMYIKYINNTYLSRQSYFVDKFVFIFCKILFWNPYDESTLKEKLQELNK